MDLRDERRRLLALWLAVAAAPLAVVPGGFTRFVFAKLLVVALACAVAAHVRPQGRLPRPITVVLLVAASWCVVAAVLGDTPVASLVGRWPRYEGLPVVGLYVAALWLGARVVGRGLARTVQVAHALGAMSLVLCAVSLLEVAGRSPLGPSTLDRPGALLGNATDQGMVGAMAALVVVGVATRYRDAFLLVSGAAALTTVALSGSRIALGVTVLGLLVVAAVAGRRHLVLVGGAVAGLAVVSVLVPGTRTRLPDLATAEARLTQWRLTLDLVRDHPLVGVGPSRYVDAFGRYEDAEWARFTGAGTLADSTHNVVLQMAVVGGIPLVAALVALAVVVLRAARAAATEHPESLPLLVAVGAYAASLAANPTVAGPTCLAAFLLGAAVAVPATDREPAWRRGVVTGVAVALSLVMAAGSLAEVRLADGVDEALTGSVTDASADVDSARSLRPLDGDVAMLAAQAFAARADAGDPDAGGPAVDLAGASLDRTPATYSSLLALGVAHRVAGDPARSRDALDRLVALFPFRADAYTQRALSRSALGDAAGARADRARARELRGR